MNTCWLIVENFGQFDYVFMRRYFFECRDLGIFHDFVEGGQWIFYAFDGHVFAGFDVLCHEDLGKGAVAFFLLQFVLVHQELLSSNSGLFYKKNIDYGKKSAFFGVSSS